MTNRILICFLAVFITATSVLHADWHLKKATGRLRIEAESGKEPAYFELNSLALPADLKNGVDVRRLNGSKIPFVYNPENKSIILSPFPENEELYVYFGFPEKQPSEYKAKESKLTPAPWRLQMQCANGSAKYLTKKEWIAERTKNLENWITRTRSANDNRAINDLMEMFPVDIMLAAKVKFVKAEINYLKRTRDILIKRYRKDRKNRVFIRTEMRLFNEQLSECYRRYNLYVGQVRLSRYRLLWRIKYDKRLDKNLANRLAKLPSQAADAQEQRIIRMFKPWRGRSRIVGNEPVSEIYLKTMPFGRRNHFATCYYGKLMIPQDGEYEFAFNSSSAVFLMVGDKLVYSLIKEHEPEKNWSKALSLKLKRGLHDFKLYYHKNRQLTFFAAGWRRKGDELFETISEEAFAPGWPCRIITCENSSGSKFPIVKKLSAYELFTGKQTKRVLQRFEVISNGNFVWEDKGAVKGQGKTTEVVFPEKGNSEIAVKQEQGTLADLKLHTPEEPRILTHLSPELYLKIWRPTFIFEDEFLDLYVEAVSELPFEAHCMFDVQTNGPNSIFPENPEFIHLPRTFAGGAAKYAPASTKKYRFELRGDELSDGLQTIFSVSMPGLVFDKRSINFIPLEDCESLVETGKGLCDKQGNMVVPVLKRPGLADLRSWSLPELLSRNFEPIQEVLVIADDYGRHGNTFSENLKQNLKSREIKTHFYNWNRKSPTIPCRQSLTELIPLIRKNKADTVLVVPPVEDARRGISVRMRQRVLSAIMQLLRSNPEVRRIYIATPLPLLISRNTEPEMEKAIKKLARDYGAELINLNYHLKQIKDLRKSYRMFEDSDKVLEPFPVGKASDIAEYLNSQLK
jgi:hypothetical protein